MNDRYLYRAKRTDNGEWVEGYYTYYPTGMSNTEDTKHAIRDTNTNPGKLYFVDPSTICQKFPCGRCSLDEKPIWENSIVTDNKRVGVVKFGLYETTNFGFYVEWNVSDRFLREVLRKDIVYWLPKIKAIGNIFDNAELLEVENR